MEIAIHLGAHCTDEDRILGALQGDTKFLREQGVLIPPPGKSRPALRKALQANQKTLLPGAPKDLAGEITDGAEAARLILSHEGFLGAYARVLAGDTMYDDAGPKAAALRDLFPGHESRFFLGIRNPATFIPALFEASSVDDFTPFISGQDVAQMRWSDVIERIRGACPEVPLVVWCNEDLPLIWPDILRAISGIDLEHSGDEMILKEIMTEAGFKRLQTYLRDNPTPTLSMWRKVVTAFLGKYVDETKVDEEIALPGWSQDLIAMLTSLYEQDLAIIRARGDVTFLVP
ncbi:hypothetical protein JANAI62_11180 [Jannaschia pagri]|uniref:Uncharacterized protein n=1 Tax=Jannaschia pagri TaxID=2829797 RepID=A0ABQ4NJA5_9RHOB|nr:MULTISPECIES: hypothetical protein [unclassified Jannaschia]GIT90663.1 hypothetical protein JANAI61_11210 [Jannaschia sp. AI_61]GIT94495.1 hypothetical protein JANAI62_11180 [Jannaschia sp. AI_62]